MFLFKERNFKVEMVGAGELECGSANSGLALVEEPRIPICLTCMGMVNAQKRWTEH